MPTVTASIGTNGRTYSTIALWVASIPANLVTDGNARVGQMYNDSEFLLTSGIGLNGFTTDATHFIQLTTGPGQSFRDNPNTQIFPLNYNQSLGVGIANNTGGAGIGVQATTQDFLSISNIQMRNVSNGDANLYFGGSTAGANILSYCILRSGTTGGGGIRCVGLQGTLTCINCAFISTATGAGSNFTSMIGVWGGGSNGTINVSNVTVAIASGAQTTGNGFLPSSGAWNIFNCACYGWASGFATSAGSTSGSNNASDLTIPFGTSNQASTTYANQFVNITSGTQDYRLVAGANLVNTGSTQTTYIPNSDDIVGTHRPQQSNWDIGASEFIPPLPPVGIVGLASCEW